MKDPKIKHPLNYTYPDGSMIVDFGQYSREYRPRIEAWGIMKAIEDKEFQDRLKNGTLLGELILPGESPGCNRDVNLDRVAFRITEMRYKLLRPRRRHDNLIVRGRIVLTGPRADLLSTMLNSKEFPGDFGIKGLFAQDTTDPSKTFIDIIDLVTWNTLQHKQIVEPHFNPLSFGEMGWMPELATNVTTNAIQHNPMDRYACPGTPCKVSSHYTNPNGIDVEPWLGKRAIIVKRTKCGMIQIHLDSDPKKTISVPQSILQLLN